MSDDSQYEGFTSETDGIAKDSAFSDTQVTPSTYDELVNRAVENLARVTEDAPAEASSRPLIDESMLPDPADDSFESVAFGLDADSSESDLFAFDSDEQVLDEPQTDLEDTDGVETYDGFDLSGDDDSYDDYDESDDDDSYDGFDVADDDESYEGDEDAESPLARAENAARIAGQSIKDGIDAFKSVREASQLHSDAREELRSMRESLEEHKAELEHRIDIEKRYPQIVSEQTAELNEATALAQQAQQRISELEADRADLENQLAITKNRNDEQLRPYLSTAESAKRRADDAARTLADKKRTVKNAEASLSDASKQRDQRIASANRQRDNAQDSLRRIDAEIESLQSREAEDPTVLERLLHERASVQANYETLVAEIPNLADEANREVSDAQQRLFDQRQQLAQVEREAEAAKKEAAARRSDYDKQLKRAQDEERALSDQIKACVNAIERAQQEGADAQDRADLAAETLQEAEAIHATPHQTIALRETVAREQTDIHMQQDAVDELAANERELRKGTFKQRLILVLGAVGVLVLIIAIVVAIILGRRSAKSKAETTAQPTQIETSADTDEDKKDSKTSATSTTTDNEASDAEDDEDEADETTSELTSSTLDDTLDNDAED